GIEAKDIRVDYIFVSHAHFDHIGSAFEIAKANDATIISTAEICYLAEENGCKAHAMHLGGTYKFPFGKVRLTLAFHGSGIPGGHACGFVVDFYDTKFYFAGDTALFGDMQLLPQLDAFDYAILPIGGNFTMDPKDAAIAAKFLAAKYVIPVHYNTWPPIAQDVEAYKADVEANTASKVLIVKPGETIELE
ncbi:MAG: metal-dependent hydrolase, partial [Phascolarctobacterium sp.]|nr:metal-dependent hydrolase [Phascolarctobacterium sp.]